MIDEKIPTLDLYDFKADVDSSSIFENESMKNAPENEVITIW